jgi:hypothetical protein|tara:strand:+ start:888 stop:1286 length:399 start_codon:yes stop_codon:yes gene_type:complete
MMLSDVVAISSETEPLTRLAERILLERFPNRIHHHAAILPNQHLSHRMMYVPVSSFQQAAEFSHQGGLLIWLGASTGRPAPGLNPVVAISGVNSVSACERAMQVAGNHLLTADQLDSLFVAFLPGFKHRHLN